MMMHAVDLKILIHIILKNINPKSNIMIYSRYRIKSVYGIEDIFKT